MLPTIVLGIGGTGKWVLTDLKRSILEKNGGKIPENVSLLAFDLIQDERPKIETKVFNLEKGEVESLTLDYSRDSQEFLNFCTTLTNVFKDVRDGKKNYPCIEKFLSKTEAKNFLQSHGKIDTCAGAGEIRLLSRTSFFLKTKDIYDKIYGAVKTVSKESENERVLTFIVSSLAGGTGCGTFIDFAQFLHHAFKEARRGKESYNIIGIFVLPRGFEATLQKERSLERFKVNCFSAFREMHRFTTLSERKICYPGALSKYSQDSHLFDMVYLVDGAKMPELKHYEGLCPAISEFILANANEVFITELPSITTNIGENIGKMSGEFDIPMYSTFGIHKYIFEVEDIKIDFAHRLSKDILNHFIAPGVYDSQSEVQNFMKGSESTQLMRILYQIKERAGTVGTDKNSLERDLKFGSREDDVDFRKMKEDDIPVRIVTKFEQVKRNAENLMKRIIGSERDMANPKNNIRTTHGVLNYYIDEHRKRFAKILKKRLLGILNSSNRKAALKHAQDFLVNLIEVYKDIYKATVDIFRQTEIDKNIQSHQKQIAVATRKKKKKRYRKLIVKLCELQQYKLLMNSIEKIIEEQTNLSEKILNDVRIWESTFREGIEKINNSQRELERARKFKRNIKIWSFVTEPDDQTEKRIYSLMMGDNPLNRKEEEINKKLPHIDFDNLIDPNQGYFFWDFDKEGKDKLSCSLPAEFAPFKTLKNDPIKWNYNFINNYLKLGQLKDLNNLTIGDVFLLKNVDAKEFAQKLNEESSFLADYDQSKQIAGKGKAQGAEKTKKILANFTPGPPGDQFMKQFKEEIKKAHSKPISQEDSHSITQVRIMNYIKYLAFRNLSSLKDDYRKEALKGPYHVFREEKNALRVEEKFEDVLQEKPDFLNFKVVELLADEKLIINFAYALWKEWIKVSGRGEYIIEIIDETTKEKRKVTLGKSRFESLKNLLLSNKRNYEEAKKEIEERTNELKDGLKTRNDVEELIKGLREFFSETKTDYKNEEDKVEKDLLKVIAVLIYDEIEELNKLKKKLKP